MEFNQYRPGMFSHGLPNTPRLHLFQDVDIARVDLETTALEPGLTTEGAAMSNDDNKPMTEDQAT
jgi:hypothetical protein